MGLAASKENQSLKKKNKKYYAPPYMRLRTRFDSIDNSTFITAAEASIDKVINLSIDEYFSNF